MFNWIKKDSKMELINEIKDLIARVENSNKVDNGGDGSGDFDHAGRPGEVGGSEPAGTGRDGKYEEGQQHLNLKGISKHFSDEKKAEKTKEKAFKKLKEANDLYVATPYKSDDFDNVKENYLNAVKEYEETFNIKFKDGNDIDDFIEENKSKYDYGSNENYFNDLEEIIETAKKKPQKKQKLVVGKVTKDLTEKAKKEGFDLEGYNHDIDISGIRHTYKEHGSEKTEIPRGQVPITDDDFYKIPSIIYDYDDISFSGKNKTGLETITYKKKMPDNIIYYVEEIRTGKKTLTINTMYKHKNAGNPKTSANNSNLLSNTSIYIIPYYSENLNPIVKNCKDKSENSLVDAFCEVLAETLIEE